MGEVFTRYVLVDLRVDRTEGPFASLEEAKGPLPEGTKRTAAWGHDVPGWLSELVSLLPPGEGDKDLLKEVLEREGERRFYR